MEVIVEVSILTITPTIVEVLEDNFGGSWHPRDVGFSLVPFGGLGGLSITEEKGGAGVLGPEPSRLLPPSLT